MRKLTILDFAGYKNENLSIYEGKVIEYCKMHQKNQEKYAKMNIEKTIEKYGSSA